MRKLSTLRIVFLIACISASTHAATLKWSNYSWEIRNDTGGPGPNTFSKDNVRVDADGSLRVQIVQRDGHWTCAELNTTERLGYGTYEWVTQSRVDDFDRNVVLGLYSYPTEDVMIKSFKFTAAK
jgi:hypothetical protein